LVFVKKILTFAAPAGNRRGNSPGRWPGEGEKKQAKRGAFCPAESGNGFCGREAKAPASIKVL